MAHFTSSSPLINERRPFGPVRKGFREPLPQWYQEDYLLVESGEYEGAAKYLQDMFQVLNDDSNRVRWEEYGVCNDIQTPFNFDAKECEKAGKDRMDLVRKAVLTTVCWRIGTLLRYTYPLRLGEALQPMEVCWELTKFFNLPNILADEADPILQIFLAIAREQNGGSFDYDAETARMLRPEIIEQPQVGPKNHVLALGALARLYRRLGRPNEAHQMVKRLAEDIDGRKYMLTPYDWLQSIDADTRSRITTYLGHDPFKNIVQISPDAAWDGNLHAIFEVHRKRGLYYEGRPIPDIPLETYKKPLQKRECWVSGCRVRQGLKQCASCEMSLYCSKEHQREAWPRHKQFCAQYKKEMRSSLENNLHAC